MSTIQDRAYETMQKDMLRRNVVSEAEFERYLPLFSTSIHDDNQFSPEYLSNLMDDYKNRFIQTLPIKIVGIVNGEEQIIRTIAPTFIQIPAINKTIKHSNELVSAHANINVSKSQPQHKKDAINDTYKQAVNLTIENDPTYQKSKDASMKITNQHKAPSVKTEEASGKTDDMEWS